MPNESFCGKDIQESASISSTAALLLSMWRIKIVKGRSSQKQLPYYTVANLLGYVTSVNLLIFLITECTLQDENINQNQL